MLQPLPTVPKDASPAAVIQRVPLWSLDGQARRAIEDSTGHPRFLCECCGYPTGDQWGLQSACFICDFEGVLPADPTFQIDTAERVRLSAQAQANFREHGSAIAPAERSRSLSNVEARLRSQLRSRYDYILAQEDPPDATERWEEIGFLCEQLRAATQARLNQTAIDE